MELELLKSDSYDDVSKALAGRLGLDHPLKLRLTGAHVGTAAGAVVLPPGGRGGAFAFLMGAATGPALLLPLPLLCAREQSVCTAGSSPCAVGCPMLLCTTPSGPAPLPPALPPVLRRPEPPDAAAAAAPSAVPPVRQPAGHAQVWVRGPGARPGWGVCGKCVAGAGPWSADGRRHGRRWASLRDPARRPPSAARSHSGPLPRPTDPLILPFLYTACPTPQSDLHALL